MGENKASKPPRRTIGRILLYTSIIGGMITGMWYLYIPLMIIGFALIGFPSAGLAVGSDEAALAKIEFEDFPSPSSSQPTSPNHMGEFGGTWDTDWGALILSQEDSYIRGEFAGAQLEGLVMHGRLFFEWSKPDEAMKGKGVLEVRGDQIGGSWGHGHSSGDGGQIKGTRQSVSAPAQQPPPPLTEELIAAFAELDSDRDGFITPEELSASTLREGKLLSDEQLSEIFALADVTEDGLIDLLEFSRIGSREALLALASSPVDDEKSAIEQKSDEIQARAEAKIEEARELAREKVRQADRAAREQLEQAEAALPESIKASDSYEKAHEQVETAVEQATTQAEQAIDVASEHAQEQLEARAEEITQATVEAAAQVQQVAAEVGQANLADLNAILGELDSAVMSSDRANIISNASSDPIRLALKVDRIDSTIGYGIDPSLRGGKTVIGTLEGVEHLVSIRLPNDMNDIATALRSGEEFEQTVKLADFNSIRKILQFDRVI